MSVDETRDRVTARVPLHAYDGDAAASHGPPRLATPRLLVVSHPSVLAVNQHVYGRLVERGWDVQLVVPASWRHEYKRSRRVQPTPLPALKHRYQLVPVALAGRPQRHFYLASVRRILRRLRPDVVFLEEEPFSASSWQWGRAAHHFRIPFGVQMDENLDRPLPAPARLFRSFALERAAFVVARSHTAAALASRWGARGVVQVVPHHVPAWETRPHPHDLFTVGYAGRLVPEKGIDTLVKAIRRVPERVELLIVGDGPLRSDLQYSDLGASQIRILTDIDHASMDIAYAQMDVLVLPSLTTPKWCEQFGRVLVEALWCGVPVIGSDSGEIPWIIETTGGGVTFPESDAESLARNIEELLQNPSMRRRFAETGRRRVSEVFSVTAVCNALEALLVAVWKHAAPPRRQG